MTESSTKVFISYSHDSPLHRAQVLELSERLRSDGVDVWLDQYVAGTPPNGWPRWMLDQIDRASFVLLICSGEYYRRFRGHGSSSKGRGVDWEGALITTHLYDLRSTTDKFVPILFDETDRRFIPDPVRAHTSYLVRDATGYAALRDFLRGRAGGAPAVLGEQVGRNSPLGLEGDAVNQQRASLSALTFSADSNSRHDGNRSGVELRFASPHAKRAA